MVYTKDAAETKSLIIKAVDSLLGGPVAAVPYRIIGIKWSGEDAMVAVDILEEELAGTWCIALYWDSDVDFRGQVIGEWASEEEDAADLLIPVSEYLMFTGAIL